MNNFIDSILTYVINYLKSSKCQIPKDCFQHMEYILNNKTVYYIVGDDLKTKLMLKDSSGCDIGTITVYNVSQVVDIPPFWANNILKEYPPCFIIGKMNPNAINWTILHEAVHLLSIGSYVPCGESNWKHYWGINEYSYQIRDGLLKVKKSEHNGINELLTDLITWKLTENCGGAKSIYIGLQYFKSYINERFTEEIDIYTLMTWYFTGNRKMKSFLLNPLYKSYEDLYENLQHNT